MDQQQAQLDFDKLSDNDKRDLQQSLNNEMQKSKIQECASVPFLQFSFPSPPISLHMRIFSENLSPLPSLTFLLFGLKSLNSI